MRPNSIPAALLGCALVFSACRSEPPAPPAAAEPPAVAVTVWTERSELFMEYPPLVAGEEARFAIHLTDIATFAPVREGRVVVRFEGDAIERFETDGPATPGIFGVTVEHRDVRSVAHETERSRPPDPAPSTRHHDDAHDMTPSVRRPWLPCLRTATGA